MKINLKVRYGLACLFELAKTPAEYVEAERIAAARAVPPAYAQKVLQSLARAGLVLSQKGSGYRLTRPLADINALEVVQALSAEEAAPAAGPGVLLERRIESALAGVTLDVLASAA